MGTDLMTLDDMASAMSVAGLLFYFLIPTILTILCCYKYNRYKKKRALKDKEKLSLKKQQEQQKEVQKEGIKQGIETINNETKAMDALSSAPEMPKEPEKFRGLALEFDETGHVKN